MNEVFFVLDCWVSPVFCYSGFCDVFAKSKTATVGYNVWFKAQNIKHFFATFIKPKPESREH